MKPAPLLWFAWKIVPLRYTKQLNSENWLLMLCCDLLEKSYLCGIQNNRYGFLLRKSVVVICLKNRTFAVYKTTWIFVNKSGQSVVICLKNRTFAVYKTTHCKVFAMKICCDLLEKSYLCGIQNNYASLKKQSEKVVICLKNRTFAVYKTTLRSWIQRRQPGCDLLEKSYLCGIQNNRCYW